MKQSTLENTAFCLILCVGLCADSLGSTPGGWWIMAGGVAAAMALYYAGQHVAYLPQETGTQGRRKRQSGRDDPEHIRSKTPAQGKKKAAAVVGTPQRQVKQSDKAIISHPYFIGVKGVRQDGI